MLISSGRSSTAGNRAHCLYRPLLLALAACLSLHAQSVSPGGGGGGGGGGVSGSGTTNYLAGFTGATAIGSAGPWVTPLQLGIGITDPTLITTIDPASKFFAYDPANLNIDLLTLNTTNPGIILGSFGGSITSRTASANGNALGTIGFAYCKASPCISGDGSMTAFLGITGVIDSVSGGVGHMEALVPFGTSNAATVPVTISGKTSQSADLLDFTATNGGTLLAHFAADGSLTVPSCTGCGTGTITGSGTAASLPLWTGTTAIGNSNATDDGTTFTINEKAVITGSLGIGSAPATAWFTGSGGALIGTAFGTCTGTIPSSTAWLCGGPAQWQMGLGGGAFANLLYSGGALGTPSSGTATNITGLPTTGLTGTLQAAQEPAHTGDMTNSAGSLATSVVKVNGGSLPTSATYVGTDSGGKIVSASLSAATPLLNSILAATGTNTIANSTNGQVWNWALTGSQTAMKFGETTAASSTGNKLINLSMLATSTAIPFQIDFPSLGATTTDAIVLSNATAAANGAQQWSPRLHWIGQGWKSNATAASWQVEWRAEIVPIQGGSSAGDVLKFTPTINGSDGSALGICSYGTSNPGMILLLDNVFTNCTPSNGGGTGFGTVGSSNMFGLFISGTERANFGANGVYWSSNQGIGWGSGTQSNSNTGDSGLCRVGANFVGINDGSTTCGNAEDLQVRHVISTHASPAIASGFAASGSTIAGSDDGGRVTVGSTTPGNTGAITFAVAYTTNAPACTANDESTALHIQASATTTTLTINAFSLATGIAANFTAADKVTWTCRGYL